MIVQTKEKRVATHFLPKSASEEVQVEMGATLEDQVRIVSQ